MLINKAVQKRIYLLKSWEEKERTLVSISGVMSLKSSIQEE